MPDSCLFCRIARGEVPSHRVYEDERLVAFLDIGPIRPGHVQVVPKEHFSYFDELPPEIAGEIVVLGQRLARALKRIYGVRRAAFLFTGGDIDHTHAHVVPMVAPTDITSRRYIAEEAVTFRAMPRPPAEELARTAQRLRDALASAP
jgi:histidine triad (HIT) family protein